MPITEHKSWIVIQKACSKST